MKAALIGYGRMGREIEKILQERGHSVVSIIDLDNRNDIAGLAPVADVAIEFTTPETAFENISDCIRGGIPVVSGTTGWISRLGEIEKLCTAMNGALFYASNFSIGVNLTFEINRRLAELMNRFGDYDVTVEETHHVMKKDAPSGTAITLADDIISRCGHKEKWKEGFSTDAGTLGISSVRRSTVPGTHTVSWESEIDSISITHTAKGRAGFATGAVLAAEFIVGKKGIFNMNDLLGTGAGQ